MGYRRGHVDRWGWRGVNDRRGHVNRWGWRGVNDRRGDVNRRRRWGVDHRRHMARRCAPGNAWRRGWHRRRATIPGGGGGRFVVCRLRPAACGSRRGAYRSRHRHRTGGGSRRGEMKGRSRVRGRELVGLSSRAEACRGRYDDGRDRGSAHGSLEMLASEPRLAPRLVGGGDHGSLLWLVHL